MATSAQGAAKKAGSTLGGAMSTAARGVTKLAATVQEKVVTAVQNGKGKGGGDDDEDMDPAEAARLRRKEAARERVRAKRAVAAEDEDDDDDDGMAAEVAASSTRGGGSKASSTAARLGDARKQALRNQELLDQMERKGEEVEDGGREFQSLAAKLKAKSKGQKF